VFGDALAVDEAAIAQGSPAHLVSNLPYNVGTPLLIKWLTGAWTPASLTLMFQKEVADRIVAAPGEDAYGRLSVIVQATCRARRVMDAPARAFTPPPKVDSAVVRLLPRPDRPLSDRLKDLERVTAAAFGQRRKMLRSSLKALGGEALATQAKVDPQARAETVDLEGFLRLAACLRSQAPD
jgi:16S rRNA (adenine1518-N6/adenine1519-N6)-dimethyltransferase